MTDNETKHGRGVCRVCANAYALRQDGTLRSHRSPYPGTAECAGSWKAPRR